MKKELNNSGRKKWDRCIRVDPPLPGSPAGTPVSGVQDLINALVAAVQSCFSARAIAYDQEARRLLASRLEPGWSISTLHLVKDSAAAMMESAGLLDDALREYLELEVAYQETETTRHNGNDNNNNVVEGSSVAATAGGNGEATTTMTSSSTTTIAPATPFGWKSSARDIEEDEAAQMWVSWSQSRKAAASAGDVGPPPFVLRQNIFACQTRLLLKLHRFTEVLERGIAFISSFSAALDSNSGSNNKAAGGGEVPSGGTHAWVFSASLSLATAVLSAQAQKEHQRRSETGAGAAGGGLLSARGAGPKSRLSQQQHQFMSARSSLDATTTTTPLKSFASLDKNPTGGGGANLNANCDTTTDDLFDGAVTYDWQLGLLPAIPSDLHRKLLLDEQYNAAKRKGGGDVASSALMARLLGQLYAMSREQLANLGDLVGFFPPGIDTLENNSDRNKGSGLKEVERAVQEALKRLGSTPRRAGTYDDADERRRSRRWSEGPISFSKSADQQYQHQREASLPPPPVGQLQIEECDGVGDDEDKHIGNNGEDDKGDDAEEGNGHREDMQAVELDVGNSNNSGRSKIGTEGSLHGSRNVTVEVVGASAVSPTTTQQQQRQSAASQASLDDTKEEEEDNSVGLQQQFSTLSVHTTTAVDEDSSVSRPGSASPHTSAPSTARDDNGGEEEEDRERDESTHSTAAAVAVAAAPPATLATPPSATARTAAAVEQQEEGQEEDGTQTTPTMHNDPRMVERQLATPAPGTTRPRRLLLSNPNNNKTPNGSGNVSGHGSTMSSANVSLATTPRAVVIGGGRGGGGVNTDVNLGLSPMSSGSGLLPEMSAFPPKQLPWLAHWRLRSALTSRSMFTDLWAALSEAAAKCYLQAGRTRNVTSYQTDLANVLLLSCDQPGRAAPLYDLSCRKALLSGWKEVAAQVLPNLARCQATLGGRGLPASLLALISLAPHMHDDISDEATTADRTEVLIKLLIKAASLPEAGAPHPPLTSHTAAAGLCINNDDDHEETDYHVQLTSPLVTCAPLLGSYSRFFGRTDPDTKLPLLLPTKEKISNDGEETLRWEGAQQARVGDVVLIQIQLNLKLPLDRSSVQLPLNDMCLVMGCLQEVHTTAATMVDLPHSDRGGSASRMMSPTSPNTASPTGGNTKERRTPFSMQQANANANANGNEQGGSAAALSLHVDISPSHAAKIGGKGGGTSLSRQYSFGLGEDPSPYATANGGGGGDAAMGSKVVSLFQEATEELVCCLVSVENNNNTPSSIHQTPITTTAAGSLVVLSPGVNILTFRACPVRRGLYKPKYIRAMLLSVSVEIPVSSSASPINVVATTTGGGGVKGKGSSQLQQSRMPWWEDTATYDDYSSSRQTKAQCIVLTVDLPVPRIEMSWYAAGGAVIAGHKQWLGLTVKPNQPSAAALKGSSSSSSSMENACLDITWPAAGVGTNGSVQASSSFFASSSSSTTTTASSAIGGATHIMHRRTLSRAKFATHSVGTGPDSTLQAAIDAATAVAPPTHPTLLPHTSTACITAKNKNKNKNGSDSSTHMTTTMMINSTLNSDEWNLSGAVRQKIELPEIWASSSEVLWWLVDVGGFVPPPHQVIVHPAPPPLHQIAPLPPQSTTPLGNLKLLQSPLPHNAIDVYIQQQQQQQHHQTYHIGGIHTSSQPTMLDMGINLEYTAGCPRGHNQMVQVPIFQPFSVYFHAQEVAGGGGGKSKSGGAMVVHASVTSNLAMSCTLTAAMLEPQAGLVLSEATHQVLKLLPFVLPAKTTADFTFILHVDPVFARSNTTTTTTTTISGGGNDGGQREEAAIALSPSENRVLRSKLHQAAKLQPTSLCLEYQLCSKDMCDTTAQSVLAAAHDTTCDAADSIVMTPPFTTHNKITTAATTTATSSSSPKVQVCSYEQIVSLEFVAKYSDGVMITDGVLINTTTMSPGGTAHHHHHRPPVLLQLLGPFNAVVGKPITLCWLLQQQYDNNSSSNKGVVRVQYEIGIEGGDNNNNNINNNNNTDVGGGWRPVGKRTGWVALGTHAGANATVEATWVPQRHGTLVVPVLKLVDVPYTEVLEGGMVMPTMVVRMV